MSNRLMLYFIATLIATSLLAAVIADCVWEAPPEEDQWQYQVLPLITPEATEKKSTLQASGSEMWQRNEFKQELAAELIAGQITLAHATDRFLELSQNDEVAIDVMRTKYSGASDREKMARNVIDFVKAQSSQQPKGVQDEVLARLETEFAAMN